MNKLCSISVLIADDHPVVREGLVSILNHEPGLQVVAEASNWLEAIAGVIAHRPGLGVVDLRMPGLEATNAIAAIHEKCPAMRIVVLTAFDAGEDVFRALQAGANGYLPKEAGKEALCECIGAIMNGKTWIHPAVASQLADRMQAPNISQRESEVLKFVAAGKSNKEIAAFLGISEGTVKVHVTRLFAKLGVSGRVAATLLALQRGIVHLPAPPVVTVGSRPISRRPTRAS